MPHYYGYPYYGHDGYYGYPYHGYYGYPYYGYGYGYGYGYPYCGLSFGFGFGFGCGYPYFSIGFGSYYPYWGWPYSYYPYTSVGIGYPYVGYYYSYPYPYLSYYDDYDCDFYNGYYVRFGYYRTSYYASCSGFGCHDYNHHHCHVCDCSVHGNHYYHVRDCPLCYPSGGSYVVQDVEVPDTAEDVVDTGSTVEQPQQAVEGTVALRRGVLPVSSKSSDVGSASHGEVTAQAVPLERGERFFASLKPAQLSFALALAQFKSGKYNEANEYYYNSSLEDPANKLNKLFLGFSLFSIGEYRFAAEYCRQALEDWPTFPHYHWSLGDLYGNPSDLQAQLSLLEGALKVSPGNLDLRLALGVIQFHSGDADKAGETFDALRALSSDPVDQSIAGSYLQEIAKRQGAAWGAAGAEEPEGSGADDAAVGAFLGDMSLKNVPALPMR
jgi:hypothetical protein